MRQGFISAGVVLGLLFCGNAGAEAAIELTAISGAVRVSQEGALPAASGNVALFCARGEYESAQVVVSAAGGNLNSVQAEVSALVNAEGQALPAECLALYRVEYVPVRHSAPRALCPPGLVADPLAPMVNPYTGEATGAPRWKENHREGPRFGGQPFAVWADRHQPVWVEVFVPRDAAPGVYTGVFTATAENVAAATLPVSVTVWPFTLPEGPSHENHFGEVERVAAYHGIKPDSEEYYRLEDRYLEMMAAHRLNPPVPRRLQPAPGEDGAVAFDADRDAAFTAYVARYHVTNIEAPRAPFGDILGADRAKAINFYRSWYAYLEQKGWAKGAYLYMLDEPNDAAAYERVRQLGALVREAEPRLRRLVVEQPYVQDPAWGSLDEAIDIWCPLFGFVHEASIARVQAAGSAVWSYSALVQTAPPYHPEYEAVKGDLPPFWGIDFPWMSYRIAPWLNRRYGITGLLYWSTVYWGSPERNPWDDPGFRIRWNGDGALFYPGADAGIEGPVASIRLKNLRDGMEDYEYFALLEAAGGRDAVEAIVREAVPTWGSWDQDPARLNARRQRLAEAIIAAQAGTAAKETPMAKVRGEMILARADHAWMSQQIEEPCILPNPKTPGRLIMFYSAVPASDRVVAAVGKAWADAREPFVWHQDEANPIFGPSGNGWDARTIRLDAVLYIPEEDAYYIYYSGTAGTTQDHIGLAICPAGADGYSAVTAENIQRFGTAPVLAPEPAAPYYEEMASQAAVLREWNEQEQRWNWYMYYSYRGKDGILPGIRLATSTDGKVWERQFNASDPRGMGQIFESTPNAYYEWHQIFKEGGTYVLCIEVGIEHGVRWRPVLAVSTDPVKGWTQLDVDTMLQTQWIGLYDDRTLYHVATPALYQIDGKWYLYVQACGRPANDNYIDGGWEMWGVACDRKIETRPGCAPLHIPGAAPEK